MNESKKKNRIWNAIGIVVGTAFMAAATNCIFEPMHLVTGGVTGIGIIVKELTGNIVGKEGVPLWITNLLCNIPLFIYSYYLRGRSFFRRGFVSAVLFTVYLAIIPITKLPAQSLLLNTIFGAVLMGAGLGMVFSAGSSTGGMDLLAILLKGRFRYLSEAQLLAVLDGAIVVLGAVVFGIEHALYALVAIFIVTKVSDSIMNGLKFSKIGYVISDHAFEISRRLQEEMERGVTGIKVTGMHTGTQRDMLMCVVSKKEIAELKEIVFDIDRKAFVVVTDAVEAVGEGFLDYRAEYTIKRSKS